MIEREIAKKLKCLAIISEVKMALRLILSLRKRGVFME